MRKLIFTFILAGVMGLGALQAQDIHFSQFYMAPLHLNPAMTGVMECTNRISANYRNQWASVISNPFNTYSASYEHKTAVARYDYAGFGGSLWGDRAGTGNFSTYQARLSGSYSKYMGGDRSTSHYLVAGADLALSQRSLNFAKLQWGTQHNGFGEYDPFKPSLEVLDDDKFMFADMSVGLLWFSNFRENSFYIGAAAAHLNRPKQTFFGDNEVKLYSKYTIHAGGEASLNDQFTILPGAVLFFQGPSFQLNAGTSARFYLSQDRYGSESFQFGVWARLVNNYVWGLGTANPEDSSEELGVDAIILSARFDYQQFGIGFSYDVNVSDLKAASNSKGAFEFSLVYYICGPERRGVYCPKF
jgi:type IX secretion system PorP/SprF family membrane protein